MLEVNEFGRFQILIDPDVHHRDNQRVIALIANIRDEGIHLAAEAGARQYGVIAIVRVVAGYDAASF